MKLQMELKPFIADTVPSTGSMPTRSNKAPLAWSINGRSSGNHNQTRWLYKTAEAVKNKPQWMEMRENGDEVKIDFLKRFRESEQWRDQADHWAHKEFELWLQGKSKLNDKARKTDVMRIAADQAHLPEDRDRPFSRNGVAFSIHEPMRVSATPWGDNNLLGVRGVPEFLRKESKAVHEAEFMDALLYYFGPQNIEQCWEYFCRFVLNDSEQQKRAPDHIRNHQSSNRYPGDVPLQKLQDDEYVTEATEEFYDAESNDSADEGAPYAANKGAPSAANEGAPPYEPYVHINTPKPKENQHIRFEESPPNAQQSPTLQNQDDSNLASDAAQQDQDVRKKAGQAAASREQQLTKSQRKKRKGKQGKQRLRTQEVDEVLDEPSTSGAGTSSPGQFFL